ncbi:lipopolysaccharide biosynthesis protein [Clostridium sp.]|uniref:lipopolysaccharide biosynthesis protein n=1 Tax=Clostridium sp. TaxID=1506 RepID=UPI003464C033
MNINKTLRVHTLINYIAKFFNIVINLYMVRLTLNYLGEDRNGLWATLLSIIAMMAIGDLGIGNGVKNRLTEALAKDDKDKEKSYISTAYITLFLISLVVCIIAILFSKIFVTEGFGYPDFKGALYIVIVGFALNFITGLINSILYAYQKSALVSIGQILNSTFLLGGVYFISNISEGNLMYIAFVYILSLTLSNIILTLYFFLNHRDVIPKISYFDKDRIRDILDLGVKFFILQVCGVILFSTDNLIISNLIGLKEVTQYDILNKVYNNMSMLYSIILIPIWSAVTYAYARKDKKWIVSILRKLQLLLLPFSLGVIVVSLFFNDITPIWLQKEIIIPSRLIVLFGVYTIVQGWTAIYCSIINGMGKINIQLYLAIIGAILNIPLSIYLGKSMGIYGVKLATFICQVLPAIILPFQLRHELKGDWNS